MLLSFAATMYIIGEVFSAPSTEIQDPGLGILLTERCMSACVLMKIGTADQ